MSDQAPTAQTDQRWYEDPSIRTLPQLVRAGMDHHRIASDVQLAERCGMSGHSRLSDIRAGRIPRREGQEQLAHGLAVPMWRIREVCSDARRVDPDTRAEWVAPDEVNSPFATKRFQFALSELPTAVHEMAAEAYVAGRRHEREVIAERLGVDVSSLEEIPPAALAGLDGS